MAMEPGSAADGRCIVLVDDDVSICNAFARIFGLNGYVTRVYRDPEALLRSGRGAEALCLVLDVNLPGMSGFELYDRLARQGAVPPVIFMTAYDDEHSRAAASLAGAVDYLAKPFSGKRLMAAIARATERPVRIENPTRDAG